MVYTRMQLPLRLTIFLVLLVHIASNALHRRELPEAAPIVFNIPFTYHDGFIVADITLSKVFPLRFIIDTGSEHTLLLKREYTDILRLPSSRKVKLLGADLKTEISAKVYPKLLLQLGSGFMQYQDIIVTDEYILPLEEMLGVRIDGILGASFFQDMALEIDYRRKTLTISQASVNSKSKEKWKSIPLHIFKNKPYITADIPGLFHDRIKKNLLLDTGASLSLVIQYTKEMGDSITSGMVKSFWGKGLGGEIEGFGTITDVKVTDDCNFLNVFTCLQELDSIQWSVSEKDGLIGNLLLQQFGIICFDFKHNKFYYKAQKNRFKEIKIMKSDVIVYAFGTGLRQYYVHSVSMQSEAWNGGMRPGDIILRVGNIPANWFNLSVLMKKINHFTSDKLKIKVNQSGVVMDLYIPRSYE